MKIVILILGLIAAIMKAVDKLLHKSERKALSRNYRSFINYLMHKKKSNFPKLIASKIINKEFNKSSIRIHNLHILIFSIICSSCAIIIGNVIQYKNPTGSSHYYENQTWIFFVISIFIINLIFDYFSIKITYFHLKKISKSNSLFSSLRLIMQDSLFAFSCIIINSLSVRFFDRVIRNGEFPESIRNYCFESFRHIGGITGLFDSPFSYTYALYVISPIIPTLIYLLIILLCFHLTISHRIYTDLSIRILNNTLSDDDEKLSPFNVFITSIIFPIIALLSLIVILK